MLNRPLRGQKKQSEIFAYEVNSNRCLKPRPASLTPFINYQVDGYGNEIFMDDANIPSLLSLPYLGYVSDRDPDYVATRHALLNPLHNPYFFNGTAAKGVGSPHTGLGNIWYMSIIMQALTSTSDREITECLEMLKSAAAPTGFMHESFDKNDVSTFTRQWFSWANSLFGELILHLVDTKPHLL